MRKLLRRTAALTLALLTFAAGTVRADVLQRGASAATTAAQTETAADGGDDVEKTDDVQDFFATEPVSGHAAEQGADNCADERGRDGKTKSETRQVEDPRQ